ncbi:MAG: hypothetical protein KDC04_01920 [Saprospiraceae bacterium]|nr:hypothetical protein [Saprospiraceae bacterium]
MTIHHISEEEFATLENAVSLIAILISGADGEIDKKEMDWAEKIIDIRSYNLSGDLNYFYDRVHENFHDKLYTILRGLPADDSQRTAEITRRLEKVNPILAKLNNHFAYRLYKSFLSLATQVAKANGGVMGFFSISKNESLLTPLPMITPIPHIAEIDEEE